MQRLRIGLAVLVTAVWLAGYILAYRRGGTNPPTELSGLMALVLGWVFGGAIKDAIKKPKDDE